MFPVPCVVIYYRMRFKLKIDNDSWFDGSSSGSLTQILSDNTY